MQAEKTHTAMSMKSVAEAELRAEALRLAIECDSGLTDLLARAFLHHEQHGPLLTMAECVLLGAFHAIAVRLREMLGNIAAEGE